MHKSSLILKELSIRKMPGLPQGLPVYKDLAANINIIAGPNASGKSSTARIIQQVIWRNKTGNIEVESSFNINEEPWQIRIDSGNIKLQRKGIDDRIEGLPAVEISNRYMLALHELVKEDEGEIAKQIARESIGGFDLEQARENLDYNEAIRSKSVAPYKEYEEAGKQYNKIRIEQLELKKEEEKLNKLFTDKREAEEAQVLKELYDKVEGYVNVKIEYNRLSGQYESFPGSLGRTTGEEYDAIQKLEDSIKEDDEIIAQAEKGISKSKDVISKLVIPESGVSEKVLNELDDRVEKLEEFERKIGETVNGIAGLKEKESEALRSIDKSIDVSGWQGPDLKDVVNLDKFLGEAHQVISEERFLQTEINGLAGEVSDEVHGSDVLSEAIRTLSYWLQEQKSIKGVSKRWLGIISAAGVVSTLLVYLTGWPGLFGVVVIAALGYMAYKAKPKLETDLRKADYERTGLPQPRSWSIEAVTKRLEELADELQRAKYRDNINRKIESRVKELEVTRERLDKINKNYDEWYEKLKALPELPSDNVKNYTGLSWFLQYVKKWREVHTELQALMKQKEQLTIDYNQCLEKVNELFSVFMSERTNDAAQANAVFKKLKDAEEKRKNEIRNTDTLNDRIENKKREKQKRYNELRDIYNKLNLEYDSKEQVRMLVEQLEEYKQLEKQYTIAKASLSEKEELMKNHSYYGSYASQIDNITPDEVKRKVEYYEGKASSLEGINKDINEIETTIKNTKQGNVLEDALKRKEEALEKLRQLYETNLSSITGKLIVDRLKSVTHEHNRPEVFKRANKLFNLITSGRYELLLDEKKEYPAFKAYDTLLQEGQELSELSTGTRIQLLLAVRLAFIEAQELSIKLPVLADELLANSDDTRAKAIIEALVEISKSGRQVFYFTAQGDEAYKWKSYLSATNDVSYKIIPLTSKTNETIDIDKHDHGFEHFKFMQDVPAPGGSNYYGYGEQLEVEPFDLLQQEPEQLHLWYLFDDSNLLYNCLRNGISRWGQLQAFLKHGGYIEGLDEKIIDEINKKVELLDRFIELYRRGRARPVSREDLERSGAITETFIDPVVSKLAEVNGNPQKLIEALRNREVPKFQQSKIEELEQYLSDQGYIDDHDPMPEDEIMVRLNALISNLDLEASKAEGFINGILI